MKSYYFLFWAYLLIWFGLAGYLLFVFLRMRKLEDRLDRLDPPGDTGREG